ncbi:MAG: restriction endonuclease subunit S [Ruminococcus bromii]|nr:restriction endonuclease subunit S [Ruminococcus bromii]
MIDTFTIRCNILHLAFSGKLTNQFKEDGTAKDILDLICEKKPIVSVEDGPYTLPESWAWIRLKDLYKINPKVIADNDTAAAFISMERISGGFDRAFTFEIQKWERAAKNHTKFEDGDVAFAKITPCFENRKSFIAHDLPNGIGGGTTELIVLRQKEMLPQYTYYLVLDQRFISTGTASYKGVVGQQRVQSDVIKNYLVPVAPYSEQKRIVKKIEQVFSILDTIDELQAQYADNLTALKSKLIDAAIQGKLTEQLPEDGTAEELIDRIKIEKEALISSRKIPKEKALPKINSGDIPFCIPENWKWVRVQDVATYMTDYVANGSFATLKANTKTYKERNYALFVRTMDLSVDFKEECSYIDKESYDFLKKSQLFGGELILPNIGASIGKAFIMPNLGMPMSLAPNSIMLKFTEPIINLYFSFIIKSSYGYKLLNKTQGGSATAKFSKTDLRSLIVPIPPLSEIKRIVKKLNEILPLCETKK